MGYFAYGWVSLTSMMGVVAKQPRRTVAPVSVGALTASAVDFEKKREELCPLLCMCLERSVEAQRGDTHSVHISTYNKLQSRTALGGEEVGSQNGKTSKPAVIADCGHL